jgi:hypothetical protein
MSDLASRLEAYLVPLTLPSADLVPGSSDGLGPYHDQLASGFAEAGACWLELKRQRDVFDQLYHELEDHAAAADAIRALAAELEEHEHRVAAGYVPGLQQIAGRLPYYHRRKKRDRSAQSMARLGEEIIEIGTTWLELLQNTRLRLLRLASVRDGEPSGPTFSDSAAAKLYLAIMAG